MACSLNTSPEPKDPHCRKMFLHKIGMVEMYMVLKKEFGIKGTSCSTAPMEDDRGVAVSSAPPA